MEPTFSVKLIAFLSGFGGLTAYGIVFGVLLACGFGVPIPEDITLIAAGILAALGKISLPGAIAIGLIGVMAGDGTLFYLGRRFGDRVFLFPVFRRIFTPQRVLLAKKKVLANSKFICFTARFLPGLRAPIFLISGVLGVSPTTFILLDGGAALISVPAWVVLGWWFGSNIDQALHFAQNMQVYLIAAVITFICAYVFIQKRKKRLTKQTLEGQS